VPKATRRRSRRLRALVSRVSKIRRFYRTDLSSGRNSSYARNENRFQRGSIIIVMRSAGMLVLCLCLATVARAQVSRDRLRVLADRVERAEAGARPAVDPRNGLAKARELLRRAERADGGPVAIRPEELASALAGVRAAREWEVSEWLLGLLGAADQAKDPLVVEELAFALASGHPGTERAALEALKRLLISGAGRFPLTAEAKERLLAAVLSKNVEVSKAATMLLSGADLTAEERAGLESVAPPLPTAPSTSVEPKPTRVEVFYGTDRAEWHPGSWAYAIRFLPAAGLLLLGLLLPPLLRWLLRPRFGWIARATRILAIGGGVVVAVITGYGVVRTEHRIDRLGIEYGGARGPFDDPEGPYCHFGTVTVGIPAGHVEGELERPGLFSGEPWEDPAKHVMVLTVAPKSGGEFFGELRVKGRERAFVFVHGFNVTFEHAALRTAQMAYDLDYDGAPIFFSWPSKGRLTGYLTDESTVAWATRHLKDFLRDVRRSLPKSTIHLVAHSMGNRALTEALRRLRTEIEAEALPRFQEVVLAAPDIDAATFTEDIAPAIRPAAERVTLYASPSDRALAASKQVHGYPRAGDAAGGVVTAKGVQSVLVAIPDLDLLGHSYYGDSGRLIDDLVALLLFRRHPELRGLTRVGEGPGIFWRLE
jgi:esterase/lipase superfamily enzyme